MFRLLSLLCKDLLNFKNCKKNFYGVYGVVGLYGSGKSLYLSYLSYYYKDFEDVVIFSNIPFNNNIVYYFDNVRRLEELYNDMCLSKNIIIFYDEIQMSFPENSKSLDSFFRLLLTQNRKNHGCRIYWTSQDYTRVNKNIRLMSLDIIVPKLFFNRLLRLRFYTRYNYERFYNQSADIFSMRYANHYYKTQKIVIEDYYFDNFNSYDLVRMG